MTNPFDLSGPDFLTLYVPLLALALAVAALVRWAVARSDAAGPLPELDAHELAYLAGGADRVTMTVVGDLVRRRAVRLDTLRGRLTATDRPTLPLPGPERLVHDVAADGIALWRVRRLLREDQAQFRRTLAAEHLLAGDDAVLLSRAVTLASVGLVMAAGVVKVCVGLSRDRPVGFLLLLTLLPLAALPALLAGPFRTSAGRTLLRKLRAAHPRPYSRTSPFALRVALWGRAALADDSDTALLARYLAPSGRARGGDGSWYSNNDGGNWFSGGDGGHGGGHGCGGHGGGHGCGGCGGGHH